MHKALALAVPLVLLLGCLGVPQDQYNTLKSSCDKEKSDLASALGLTDAKASELNRKLSDCTSARQADQGEIDARNAQIASLKNDSMILSQARAKAQKMMQYNLALSYYNDAFGPGKVPNTPRISRIDAQVASLSDPSLYSLWKSVLNCQGLSDCENAKQRFTALINASTSSLAMEVVDIVK